MSPQRYSSIFLQILVILSPLLFFICPVYPHRHNLILGLLLLMAILLLCTFKAKKSVRFSRTDLAVTIFCGVVALSLLIHSTGEFSLLTVLMAALYLGLYITARNSTFTPDDLTRSLLICGLIQAAIVLLQYTGIIASWSYPLPPSGTFRNPAPVSALLGLAIVATLYSLIGKNRKLSYTICLIILLAALALTYSRAAWLATFVAAGYILLRTTRIKSFRYFPALKIVAISLFVLFAAGLYFVKKDSANGRLLIWRVSVQMISEHPVLGTGPGTFSQIYPFYQARYFQQYPESVFAKTADDIVSPFNELLSITTQTGLLGLLAFGFIVFLILRQPGNVSLKAILLTLLVFGLFSYPLRLPVFGFIFVLIAALSYALGKLLPIPRFISVFGCFVLISGVIWTYGEVTTKAPITYKNSTTFLGSRVPILLQRKDVDSLETIFPKIPSVELCVELAKISLLSEDYEKARYYSELGGYMVPNRIMPWYLLFRTFELQANTDSAAYYARITAHFEAKVENTTTLKAKREARAYLKGLEASDPTETAKEGM